jgi:hypothetical protein
MAESVRFEIKLAVSKGGKKREFSLAELGVLLTGINRAINKAFAAGADIDPAYFPLAQEPMIVRSEVLRIENGSIVLTIASSVSEFVDKNVLQAAFLSGIFGNAAWDFTKLVGKEVARAARRLGASTKVETEYVRIDPTLGIEPARQIPVPEEIVDRTSRSATVVASGQTVDRESRERTTYTVTFIQEGTHAIEVSVSFEDRER